jgi:site-specific DNA-methyltransferase (cytosine-N4-specific)
MRDEVLYGDALAMLGTVPSGIVQTCVCSPPYFGLRSYLPEEHSDKVREIGLERTPEEYVARLVEVMREIRRTLRANGTLWLVIGDTYWNQSPVRSSSRGAWETKYTGGKISEGKRRSTAGHKTLKVKDLIMVPARVALALQADGWWLRAEIVWHKSPTCMPEAVMNRPTRAHETILMLSRSARYFYNVDAVTEPTTYREHPRHVRGPVASPVPGAHPHTGLRRQVWSPTRRLRSVWAISPQPFAGAHRATFPEEIPSRCIRLSTRPGDLVIDPFAGSGTTLQVAKDLDRDFLGIELNEGYRQVIEARTLPAIARAHQREMFREMMAMDNVG